PGPGPHLPGPYLSPGPNIDVDVGLWWLYPVDVYPPYEPDLPYPPGEPQEASPTEPPPSNTPPPPPGSPGNGPAGAVASGEVPPLPAEEFQEITVDPPPQLPVEARGFFDGDRLVLEAAVIDRSSGETLRTKSVERKVDPRNAAAVKRAVDELLSTDGWNAPEAPGSQSGNPP
ncbi:MAG TPA: hypothetical protein VFG59_04690, partial [Anaeromyxobacter sp.]|nr:hypothetical protein [Anaeromyxobacter sp.]